jgi:lipocalin
MNQLKEKTIKNVDLSRYAGHWYEIARLPNSFEKGLIGVTAKYTLKNNGKIEVLNQGYLKSFEGKLKSARGRARIPDPQNTGRLKVSFFLFFGADYLIFDLDTENYQYALVGSNSYKYLWILSRSPQMDESVYQRLVEKAKQLGFNTNRLIKVPQR